MNALPANHEFKVTAKYDAWENVQRFDSLNRVLKYTRDMFEEGAWSVRIEIVEEAHAPEIIRHNPATIFEPIPETVAQAALEEARIRAFS